MMNLIVHNCIIKLKLNTNKMSKFLVLLATFFTLSLNQARSQSIITLENLDNHLLSLLVLKPDTLFVDAICISATYYGNETDNAVVLTPVWSKKYNLYQYLVDIDVSSFDMSKPFMVTLKSKGAVIKTYEMSRRILINGQIYSNFETL